jgi:toxin CptA
MPGSTRWSSASGNFRPDARRIAWRPSRWVIAALLMLSALAPFAVLASEMPRVAAWPLAGAAFLAGLAMARREARRPPRMLELPAATGANDGKAGRATLDGVPLVDAALSWRGPLAFLRWRDDTGRRGRLSWWPDTLPPAERRVLKLWSPDGPGMAP